MIRCLLLFSMPYDVYKLVCKFCVRIWDQGGSKMGILDGKLGVPERAQPEQGNCSGEISIWRVSQE